MIDKIGGRMCQLDSYRLSHSWYLTAPPAVDLVTVDYVSALIIQQAPVSAEDNQL
jgi:hypothetical protein